MEYNQFLPIKIIFSVSPVRVTPGLGRDWIVGSQYQRRKYKEGRNERLMRRDEKETGSIKRVPERNTSSGGG